VCMRAARSSLLRSPSSLLSVLCGIDRELRFSIFQQDNFSRNLPFRSIRSIPQFPLSRSSGYTGDDSVIVILNLTASYSRESSHPTLLPPRSLCQKLSHTRPHNLSHNKLSRPAISATRSDAIGIICYGRGCRRVERWTNRGNQCRSPLGGPALKALRELQMRFCI
jgi:hypothetical protein